MFDLEKSIVAWRKQMLAAGVQTPAPLDELELHLREEFERQMKLKPSEKHAFEAATAHVGQAKTLKLEFDKVKTESRIDPLAWCAWFLFAVSFFLPVYDNGHGWRCAWFSLEAFASPEFWHGEGLLSPGSDFYLALLTPANVLMAVSPFLLARFSQNPRFVKYWSVSGFFAMTLAWSYIFIRLTYPYDRQRMELGCYVWIASFLLLFISAFKARRHETQVPEEQYV